MASIPKVESNDVRKSIIRTTIHNENLLAKKMENPRIKKNTKKKTSSLKHKVERSDKLSGVLSMKIEQSIARAKYVQNLRKAGWDQINKSITIKNDLMQELKAKDSTKSTEELEKEVEDEYVKKFFEDGEKAEEKEEEESTKIGLSNNAFALLEETEA